MGDAQQPPSPKSTMLSSLAKPAAEDDGAAELSVQEVLNEIKRESVVPADPPPMVPPPAPAPFVYVQPAPAPWSISALLEAHKNNILLVILYVCFALLDLGNVVNMQNLGFLRRVPNALVCLKAILFVVSYNVMRKHWH